jgi:hypothetical protein
MKPAEALERLRALSSILEHVPYEEILSILKDSIKKIPIPLAKLAPNSPIDRVRKNIGDALFTNVHEELSYIKNQHVIDNYLTEYGRANKPHQPMFYGSVESTLIGTPRITAIAETSELFQNRNAINFNGELYTISRWRNSSELVVVEIVFAKEAIAINPDIKKAFEKQTEFAQALGIEDVDFFKEFLIFISEEFAREKKTHSDYKIATAYAELVLSRPDIHGIAFPSVQTKYHGQNLVLPPATVDAYLLPEVLSTQRLYKNKLNMLLTNHKNCLDPMSCLDNIIWTDVEVQYTSTREQILASLNQPQPQM